MNSCDGGKPHQFPLIDVLRAFAALSVVTLHVIAHANWTDFPQSGPLAWFRHGNLGVDLFFVISGFVISLSAMSMYEKRGVKFIGPYVKHRLFRIVPLFYLTMAAYLIVDRSLLSDQSYLSHILSHMMFCFTFDPNKFSSINGVNWSVGIEMQFYLLILLVAPALFWIRKKPVIIVITIVAAMFAASAWRYCAALQVPDDNSPVSTYLIFVYITQLPGHLDEFGLGIALALFVRSELFASLSGRPIWCIALFICVVPLFYAAVVASNGIISRGISMVAQEAVYSVAFAALVLLACSMPWPGLINGVSWARYVGTISYGIYLWHLPVIKFMKTLTVNPPQMLIATLAITLGLASLSWHTFEKPLIGLSRVDFKFQWREGLFRGLGSPGQYFWKVFRRSAS
jgi:peptidoglycan/LPS O-acetylase OafA/YrhL